jgi:hypothetical protein
MLVLKGDIGVDDAEQDGFTSSSTASSLSFLPSDGPLITLPVGKCISDSSCRRSSSRPTNSYGHHTEAETWGFPRDAGRRS